MLDKFFNFLKNEMNKTNHSRTTPVVDNLDFLIIFVDLNDETRIDCNNKIMKFLDKSSEHHS